MCSCLFSEEPFRCCLQTLKDEKSSLKWELRHCTRELRSAKTGVDKDHLRAIIGNILNDIDDIDAKIKAISG